jgi:hypothetical protein
LAAVQRGFELIFGFQTITGIKQAGKVGVDAFKWAEISVQESYCGKPVEYTEWPRAFRVSVRSST